jgi:hypothetical protein
VINHERANSVGSPSTGASARASPWPLPVLPFLSFLSFLPLLPFLYFLNVYSALQ